MPNTPLLDERASTHGHFVDQFLLAQRLKNVVRDASEEEDIRVLPAVMAEAVDMLLMKISRIVTGDPWHADHWADIAGYAERMVEYVDSRPLPPLSDRIGVVSPLSTPFMEMMTQDVEEDRNVAEVTEKLLPAQVDLMAGPDFDRQDHTPRHVAAANEIAWQVEGDADRVAEII